MIGVKFNTDIYRSNKESIDSFNYTMAKATSLLLAVIDFTVCFIGHLKPDGFLSSKIYLVASLVATLIFGLLHLKLFKKHCLQMIYLIISLTYLYGICISLRSPNERATIFLGVLCIGPICILDKNTRLIIMSFIAVAIHGYLSIRYKGMAIGLQDLLNTLIFSSFGLLLSFTMKQMTLNGFEANKQLQIERITDVLTGLYNRRKLFEDLIEDNSDYKAIMMLDFDDFKKYNDAYGHIQGDSCLQSIGSKLKAYSSDVVFYRYGGEEFVGLYKGDIKDLEATAQNIRSDIENLDYSITVSIGVALFNKRTTGYEASLNHADSAMYQAKDQGKNKVCFYKD